MAPDSDRPAFPDGPTMYHQLRWDPRFDPSACEIVLTDRPSGTKSIPFREFIPNGPIPWHRIVAFWYRGELLWDRARRIDRRDEALHSGPAQVPIATGELTETDVSFRVGSALLDRVPASWSLLTWNVMSDTWDGALLDHPVRWRRLLDDVIGQAPTFAIFTEARGRFAELALTDERLDGYTVISTESSDVLIFSRVAVSQAAALELSPGRSAVIAQWDGLTLAGVHLLSDREKSRRVERERDLERLHQATLGTNATVIAGDLNAPDHELEVVVARFRGKDAWLQVHPDEPGSTYDVERNPLAAALTSRGRSGRLDRVLLFGEQLRVTHASLIGTHAEHTSDHFGLSVSITKATDAISKRSAVVLRPPTDAWGPIQRLRARHDRGFLRWPPHVTLLYGFVEPTDLEAAQPRLSAVAAKCSPFEVHFDRVITFEHDASITVALAPRSDEGLRALERALVSLFPQCLEQRHEGRFTPHLTIARLPKEDVATRRALERSLGELSLSWTVRSIDVLERPGDTFLLHASVEFGSGTISLPEPRPAADLGPLGLTIEEALQTMGATATVEPFGSRVWGPSLESKDLDVLVKLDEGAGVFLDLLAQHHPTSRRVGRHVLRGESFDVVALDRSASDDDAARFALGPLDANTLRETLVRHGRATIFDAVIPRVRAWAKERALEGNAFGYFGGIGWAMLLAAPLIEDARLCSIAEANAFDGWRAWAGRLTDRSLVAFNQEDTSETFTILGPAKPPRAITRALIPSTRRTLLEELRHHAQGTSPVLADAELLVRGPIERAGDWLRTCLSIFTLCDRELGPVLRPYGEPIDPASASFTTRIGLRTPEAGRVQQLLAHQLARLELSDVGVFVRPVPR